jgi:hypothetical protein
MYFETWFLDFSSSFEFRSSGFRSRRAAAVSIASC